MSADKSCKYVAISITNENRTNLFRGFMFHGRKCKCFYSSINFA